jgi:phosphatidylserine decarboxylase
LIAGSLGDDDEEEEVETHKLDTRDEDDEEDDEENAVDTSEETDDPTKPEVVAKRKRKLRLKRLRRKTKARAYEFTGSGSDVIGIVFLEIVRITDLPPERNGTIRLIFLLLKTLIDDSNANFLRYGSFCGRLTG